MQKIFTASKTEYSVKWLGLSTIDYVLRFLIVDVDIATVFQTFTNSEETATITHVFDEKETVYDGYTQFRGMQIQADGIVVALNQAR